MHPSLCLSGPRNGSAKKDMPGTTLRQTFEVLCIHCGCDVSRCECQCENILDMTPAYDEDFVEI